MSTHTFYYINDIHYRENKTKTTTTKQRSLKLEQAAYICQNLKKEKKFFFRQSFINTNPQLMKNIVFKYNCKHITLYVKQVYGSMIIKKFGDIKDFYIF